MKFVDGYIEIHMEGYVLRSPSNTHNPVYAVQAISGFCKWRKYVRG